MTGSYRKSFTYSLERQGKRIGLRELCGLNISSLKPQKWCETFVHMKYNNGTLCLVILIIFINNRKQQTL